jgi:hypothetical protein
MMSFQDALDLQKEFQAQYDAASEAMKVKYPEMGTGAMGMTPEHIRMSAEYRADKAKVDHAFTYLRNINGYLNKHFKKEYAKHFIAERDERRAKTLAASASK